MLKVAGSYDVVHVHGCSQKNVPVAILARLLGKPIVLTSAHQRPGRAGRRQAPRRARILGADARRLVLCVSPDLCARWTAANLPADRVRLTPNGVDTSRFRPADAGERARAPA